MNIQFSGSIAHITPPGVPAYDPSRWVVNIGKEDAMIRESLPPGPDGNVTSRRILLIKASAYMSLDEAEHIARRIVADCQRAAELDATQKSVDKYRSALMGMPPTSF